ncbi:unnamed protein product [Symbiodinium sp. CCMP2592]|nr:unnamed protein product [Symbiodinium sp. CCMP2592]
MAAMATFASELQVCTKNTFLHCEDREGEDRADGLLTRSLSCPAFMTDVTTAPCRSTCPSVVKSPFEEDDRYSSVSTANQEGLYSSPCGSDVECLSELSGSSRTNSPLNIGSRTNSPCNLGVVGIAVPMVLTPTAVPGMPQAIQMVEVPMPTPQQAIQQPCGTVPAAQLDLSGPAGQVAMLVPQQAMQQPSGTVPASQLDLPGPVGQVAMLTPQHAIQQPSGTVPATQLDHPGPAGQVAMLVPQQAIQQPSGTVPASQLDLPGPVGQVAMLTPQQAIQQPSGPVPATQLDHPGPAGQVAMLVPQQAMQQPSGTVPASQLDLPGPVGQVAMLTPQQAIQQPVPLACSGSHAAVQVSAAAPANERRAPTSKTSDQQKRINRELVVAGKRSSLEVLKVVQRNIGQMNGVNLATAFHRISRGGVDLQRVSGSGIFNRLLEVAECCAEQELASRDEKALPANCCTIIAWSCAQLRVFRPSLFAKLAGVATPHLRSCQPYEVTNMLWAFAEFYKYDQDSASGVAPELRVLLDAVADVFSTRSPGDFKVQVLTSALMSVSALPWDQSFSSTWLLNSTFQELSSRWEELELEGQAQVAVALERLRVKCAPFFNSLLSSAGQTFPAVKISLEAHLLSRVR